MKIIAYSDLHLEFHPARKLRPDAEADVMVLAGDIITLRDYDPLDRLLRTWKKPVFYVTGNHEYYTQKPMNEEEKDFRAWLESEHPRVRLLLDEGACIDGVNFFGGTMWTDFNGGDSAAMKTAQDQMNDFRLIRNPDGSTFTPADAIALHKNFARKLLNWFDRELEGPRVVISHSAPVIHPNSKYKGSPLTATFSSLDMVRVIELYQPSLWVYGHTHECNDQTMGKTRIISNQLGYPGRSGAFECGDFDETGLPTDLGV